MYLLGHKGASKTRFIEPREPLCEVPPIDAFLPPFPFYLTIRCGITCTGK